ncbi:arginase [Kamptonema cortianum]|nr:arginase [Kamptonema cortianum]
MVELIGAPFDLCGPYLGSRLGPSAVRLLGLEDSLRALQMEVKDGGDAFAPLGGSPSDYGEKLKHAVSAYSSLKVRVGESLASGNLPLVIGGDHSLAMGSISGALEHFGSESLAVLWIDAHMDLNTPSTSGSGNFHGMPLAALCRFEAGDQGEGDHPAGWWAWDQILREICPNPGLGLGRIGWIGLRDVDAGEVANYHRLTERQAYTMQDIDHDGIANILDKIDAWLLKSGATKVWISFDVDSLDPNLAPGTGTKVRGGLTYREGHFLAELLHEMLFKANKPYSLAGLDVVEVNPMSDQAGQTAIVANEWVASFFGKTIMGVNG